MRGWLFMFCGKSSNYDIHMGDYIFSLYISFFSNFPSCYCHCHSDLFPSHPFFLSFSFLIGLLLAFLLGLWCHNRAHIKHTKEKMCSHVEYCLNEPFKLFCIIYYIPSIRNYTSVQWYYIYIYIYIYILRSHYGNMFRPKQSSSGQ